MESLWGKDTPTRGPQTPLPSRRSARYKDHTTFDEFNDSTLPLTRPESFEFFCFSCSAALPFSWGFLTVLTMGLLKWATTLMSMLPGDQRPPVTAFLSVSLCNGLCNQEVALLSALALALEHGVGLVLPAFVADGRQNLASSLAPVVAGNGVAALKFEHMFDAPRFVAALAAVGVPAITADAAAALGGAHDLETVAEEAWATFAASGARVAVLRGCVLGAAPPALLERHGGALTAALSALVPAHALRKHVERVQAALGGGRYDAVHLRYEKDWAPLCAFWSKRPLSPDPRHCGLLPPTALVEQLEGLGVGREGGADAAVATPVFVAVDELALDDPAPLAALRERFRVVTRREASVGGDLPREVGALVDFHVAFAARTFVGNSYSTFSGLLILARQQAQLPSSWYNVR